MPLIFLPHNFPACTKPEYELPPAFGVHCRPVPRIRKIFRKRQTFMRSPGWDYGFLSSGFEHSARVMILLNWLRSWECSMVPQDFNSGWMRSFLNLRGSLPANWNTLSGTTRSSLTGWSEHTCTGFCVARFGFPCTFVFTMARSCPLSTTTTP
jgi:hypothetical protein